MLRLENFSCFIMILIERADFTLEMGRDRVASQFAVSRQQPALDSQRLLVDVESVDAFVMRQLGVDPLQGLLDLLAFDIAGDERGQETPPVAHHHALLRAGQIEQDLFFDRFWRDVVARIENDQVLDATDDGPIALLVNFALITRAEPTVVESLRRRIGLVPITREDIRPMNQNFIAFAETHLDAWNRGTYAAGREIARVVHSADRRRLGQSVNLQDADAEHREKQLGLFRQRRRAADQSLQISSDLLFDRRENQRVSEREPEARRAFTLVLS